jgi:hypothetical protein
VYTAFSLRQPFFPLKESCCSDDVAASLKVKLQSTRKTKVVHHTCSIHRDSRWIQGGPGHHQSKKSSVERSISIVIGCMVVVGCSSFSNTFFFKIENRIQTSPVGRPLSKNYSTRGPASSECLPSVFTAQSLADMSTVPELYSGHQVQLSH